VALRRGHPELVTDLAEARHPHPAGPVVDVVRRHRQAPARAAVPGSDTLGQLHYIMGTGYDYSWFILTQSIIKKEFALSGSEQNPISPARAG
jgi:predicted oxidoreductase